MKTIDDIFDVKLSSYRMAILGITMKNTEILM